MLISLNELKKLVNIKISDEELFSLIGSRLVEIENVEDLAPKYKKIYLVKVLSTEKIEGTHLSLCQIDAGEKLNAEFDPDHADSIQVVCGAPNVKKDMFAVWIAPGAVVPATFETAEPFEISARKLRGFMSYGMLAGADELALGDDHSGIVEIDPNFATPGNSFAEKFDLNDKIIEVENKSLTHRPDCFGLIGFAREVAGILGEKFTFDYFSLKKSYESALDKLKTSASALPLSVKIEDYSLCPRYEAFVFEFNSLPERSPFLSLDDIFLYKAGMRPVSPIVDLTNLIMLKTAQPSHAFDYDKFVRVGAQSTANLLNSANLSEPGSAPRISVRAANPGEKLVLLDDKEIELSKNDIIITSNDVPVALAGAMGGKSTEIDASTKKVILEIASFSLYHLRKTQMAHGIFSEAITRFTKGRPATDLLPAAADSLSAFASLGAELKSFALDSNPALYENGAFKPNVVEISPEEINSLLGSNYPTPLIKTTLENVGFLVELKNLSESSSALRVSETLQISAPRWRTDIKIKEDIIEEVGRLLGYDNLPLAFPSRPFKTAKIDESLALKSRLREILSSKLRFNEVLTYSFVSEDLLKRTNLDPEDSYKLVNSLSPELQRFRTDLIPSLLDKFRENIKTGFKDFTLYEINQISKKSFGLTEENVPALKNSLALLTSGDFYKIKSILAAVFTEFNLPLEFSSLENHPYFEPLRAVELKISGVSLGFFGELKKSVLKNFKLSAPLSGFTLDPEKLLELKKSLRQQEKSVELSRFPSVSRDITFRVATTSPYEALENSLNETLKNENLIYKLSPVSIYQDENNREEKHISFHLVFSDKNKTLASAEISAIMEKIAKNSKELGAEVV